jgi:hypothetical protein
VTRKNLNSDGSMDTISNLSSASHNTNANKQKKKRPEDSQHPWEKYGFTRRSFKEKAIKRDNLIKL